MIDNVNKNNEYPLNKDIPYYWHPEMHTVAVLMKSIDEVCSCDDRCIAIVLRDGVLFNDNIDTAIKYCEKYRKDTAGIDVILLILRLYKKMTFMHRCILFEFISKGCRTRTLIERGNGISGFIKSESHKNENLSKTVNRIMKDHIKNIRNNLKEIFKDDDNISLDFINFILVFKDTNSKYMHSIIELIRLNFNNYSIVTCNSYSSALYNINRITFNNHTNVIITDETLPDIYANNTSGNLIDNAGLMIAKFTALNLPNAASLVIICREGSHINDPLISVDEFNELYSEPSLKLGIVAYDNDISKFTNNIYTFIRLAND